MNISTDRKAYCHDLDNSYDVPHTPVPSPKHNVQNQNLYKYCSSICLCKQSIWCVYLYLTDLPV